MKSKSIGCALAALLITMAILPQTAGAFDAGPHFDVTRDALAAEGFENTAIQVVQVTNWMTDFYEQASENPYSGRAAWWKELLSGAYGWREHWPDSVVNAADWLHFDSTPEFIINGKSHRLDSSQSLAMEWDRLARATRAAARDRANAGDILGLLTVLGISTHAVQDFYAHTNWVEPAGIDGYDGPGWAQQGACGPYPTWFDIPQEDRQVARLYAGVGRDGLRSHGDWNSDRNQDLTTALNKDWPGRPYYQHAYITSYFATRQWVRAVRSWVDNESVWRAARQFNDRHGAQLDHDVNGSFSIQFNAGHWQGQGEPAGADAPGPGGSLDDLIGAISMYHRLGKTVTRSKFEEVVTSLADPSPPTGATPVQSSRDMQAATDFIAVKVTRVHDATPGDTVGIDPGPDEADFYARANIAGQQFTSGMIHGYDTFNFRLPNYPFTFIKAVPKGWRVDEPVTKLQVKVRTCDATWAGTDDDVFLRINDRTRFLLDKPLYDDFERDDEDTYSLKPSQGLRVKDIQYLQIEKAPDGTSGGWKLCGVALQVNGSQVYQKGGIHKWLEDNHRTWRASDFYLPAPTTDEVPITVRLYDSDGGLYGGDDHCDIHPDFNRYDLNVLYDRGTSRFRGDVSGTRSSTSRGGSNHGGRGTDSDKSEIGFSIETYSASSPSADDGGAVAQEDCLPLDWQRAEVKRINGRWKIVVGDLWVLDLDAEEADARKALQFIKHYQMNSQCFVGRPQAEMEYYLVNGAAPAGAFTGEDCLGFNPDRLEVRRIDGNWKIVDGSHWLLDFGVEEAQARTGLGIIKKYSFTEICFVGRPNAPMQYFRK